MGMSMSNNCEVVIVPQNLTNKFQPLDLSVNKAAKAFISEKYNTWMTNEISRQIKRGIAPPDVKVSFNLSVIRLLHAKWIVDLHHYLKAEKAIILSGFRAAGISEAIENAKSITEKVENPFKDLQIYSRNIAWSKHKMSKQHFVFSPVLFPPPNTVDFLKARSNCSVKRSL